MVILDRYFPRLEQVNVSRSGAGHCIDNDDMADVFEVMERIQAAIAAIDNLGLVGTQFPAQGEGDGRPEAVVAMQRIAETEDARARTFRH